MSLTRIMEKEMLYQYDKIKEHYGHACEKHPAFADMIFNHKAMLMPAKYYKEVRDTNHALGMCTPLDVLLAEYAEVIEAMRHGGMGPG